MVVVGELGDGGRVVSGHRGHWGTPANVLMVREVGDRQGLGRTRHGDQSEQKAAPAQNMQK